VPHSAEAIYAWEAAQFRASASVAKAGEPALIWWKPSGWPGGQCSSSTQERTSETSVGGRRRLGHIDVR